MLIALIDRLIVSISAYLQSVTLSENDSQKIRLQAALQTFQLFRTPKTPSLPPPPTPLAAATDNSANGDNNTNGDNTRHSETPDTIANNNLEIVNEPMITKENNANTNLVNPRISKLLS